MADEKPTAVYVPGSVASWPRPATLGDTAVSIEWVLNLLAGGSYPAQGSAYDHVKAAWEATRIDPLAEIDDEFTRYFIGLGYTVTWDFKRSTGQRWYEIVGHDGLLVQVDFGTPLAAFLEDLPLFAEGKQGTSAAEYTACGPAENFAALYRIVRAGGTRRSP